MVIKELKAIKNKTKTKKTKKENPPKNKTKKPHLSTLSNIFGFLTL